MSAPCERSLSKPILLDLNKSIQLRASRNPRGFTSGTARAVQLRFPHFEHRNRFAT
jgi:hypothetical protein